MNGSAALDLFRSQMPGKVSEPGDDAYQRATSPRNTVAHQAPALVVTASDASDVAAAVRCASQAGLSAVVQASGHGAAPDLGNDNVLVDTSHLDAIEIDARQRVVRAGAGATFGQINQRAYEHGLLAPAGTAPDVAVVGYTVFGGVGWLTRPHGMASASLLSVDVVDGSGRSFTATDREYEDVLWAYRGGGGVGIATAVEMRLYDAADLWGGYVLWPVDDARTVLTAWGRGLTSLHPSLTSAIGLLHAPDAPTIPESLRGSVVVHLSAASVAGASAGRSLEALLDQLPEPAMNTLGRCDATRLAGIHLDPPAAVPGYGEGRWLTIAAAEHAFDILAAAGTDPGSALNEVELRHLAAPRSDVPGAETSCPGEILLHATGEGTDAAARNRTQEALDRVLAAARPFDTGHSAASFRDGHGSAPDGLAPAARERLAAIRQNVDPSGVIAVSKLLA